jgi:Lar family restriction alleviation protein
MNLSKGKRRRKMTTKLKPCPFCGGEAITKKYYPYDGYQGESAVYRVYCKNCKANIEGHYLEGMIEHWNGRVNEDGKGKDD